jgi:hypothetical protein
MEESKNCLVGKFFHKMYVDDAGRTRIKNQGIVRDYFDGVWVVEYFEWVLGEPVGYCKLVEKDYIMDCQFYLSCEDMNDEYDRNHATLEKMIADEEIKGLGL